MNTINPEDLEKLQFNVQLLLMELKSHNHLAVHQSISQFYYMQKNEELTIMNEQLRTGFSNVQCALERLEDINRRTSQLYYEVHAAWLKDLQWLRQHLKIMK